METFQEVNYLVLGDFATEMVGYFSLSTDCGSCITTFMFFYSLCPNWELGKQA